MASSRSTAGVTGLGMAGRRTRGLATSDARATRANRDFARRHGRARPRIAASRAAARRLLPGSVQVWLRDYDGRRDGWGAAGGGRGRHRGRGVAAAESAHVRGVAIRDWDSLCLGPAPWDHAPLRTWERGWGGPREPTRPSPTDAVLAWAPVATAVSTSRWEVGTRSMAHPTHRDGMRDAGNGLSTGS